MKKKIMEIINAKENKTLKLNDIFSVCAYALDENGNNVELTGKETASVKLELVYTAKNDKMLLTSETIYARDYDGFISEVSDKMTFMMRSYAEQLVKQFKNGYLA